MSKKIFNHLETAGFVGIKRYIREKLKVTLDLIYDYFCQ